MPRLSSSGFYGDADGDGIISRSDAVVRDDITGDGKYDLNDLLAVRTSVGKTVDLALLDMIDD